MSAVEGGTIRIALGILHLTLASLLAIAALMATAAHEGLIAKTVTCLAIPLGVGAVGIFFKSDLCVWILVILDGLLALFCGIASLVFAIRLWFWAELVYPPLPMLLAPCLLPMFILILVALIWALIRMEREWRHTAHGSSTS